MPNKPTNTSMKVHYTKIEDIQKLREQITEFKQYVITQSTFARNEGVTDSYTNLGSGIKVAIKAIDTFLEIPDFSNLETMRHYLDTLKRDTFIYNASLYGVDEATSEKLYAKLENQEKLTEEEEKEAGKIGNDQQELYQFYQIFRQADTALVADMNREAEHEEENSARDQEAMDEADLNSMRTKVQVGLQNVKPISTSGYGPLYDTIARCIEMIDNDRDLTILAGDQYPRFKSRFRSWQDSVEKDVARESRATPDLLVAVLALKDNMESFFETIATTTNAFDGMKEIILSELAEIRSDAYANPDMRLQDVLNHKEPEEVKTGYRQDVAEEVIHEDLERLAESYYQPTAKIVDLENRLNSFVNKYVMEIPYTVDGVEYQGDALLQKMNDYIPYCFGEFNRNGNQNAPLISYLEGIGISHEQLYVLVTEPDSQEAKVMLGFLEEARQKTLDITFQKDIEIVDDQASDLLVRQLLAYEKKLEELIKNPTLEAITKFAAQAARTKSVLEQGMPDYTYNASGELMVKGSIDRKLKEMGKPYDFEQIYGVINSFTRCGTMLTKITPEGKFATNSAAMTTAYNAQALQKQLLEMRNSDRIEDGIAAFDVEHYAYLTVNTFVEGPDSAGDYDQFMNSMADAITWSGMNNPVNLLAQMKEQKEENGASKEFDAVLNALETVEREQRYGMEQRYINEAYDALKKACDAYLDHRHPLMNPGTDRYRLITRIDLMVDHSQLNRQKLAETEQKAREQQPEQEIDQTFQTAVNTFKAATQSVFGDSTEMKEIKRLADELAFYQTRGLKVPAFDGDVNWFSLYKACAEYIANPDKKDNARKDAVRTLMGAVNERFADWARDVAEESAAQKSDRLNAIFDMTVGQKEQIPEELAEFERSIAEEKQQEQDRQAAQRQAEKDLDDNLRADASLLDIIDNTNNKVYLDGIFASNLHLNPVMDKHHVYDMGGGNKFIIKEAPLSDQAKEGLKILGLQESDFSHIAMMEYLLNTHDSDLPEGDINRNYRGKDLGSDKLLLGMLLGNVTGSEFRANIISTLSKGGDSFHYARNNVNEILGMVGVSGDITPVAKMMAKMLKVISPAGAVKNTYNSAYVSERAFIHSFMGMLDHNEKLEAAILDTGLINEADLNVMRGYAKENDLAREAAWAKIRVINAKKSGITLSDEELRNCYKAILKAGLPYGEHIQIDKDAQKAIGENPFNQEIAAMSTDMSQLTTQIRMIQGQENLAPEEKENQIKQLKDRQAQLNQEIQKKTIESDNYEKQIKANVKPMLVHYIGAEPEAYDDLVESMIPENLTLDQVLACTDNHYSFEQEYNGVAARYRKDLEMMQENTTLSQDWPKEVEKQINLQIPDEEPDKVQEGPEPEGPEPKMVLPDKPKPVPKGDNVTDAFAKKMDKQIAFNYNRKKIGIKCMNGGAIDAYFAADFKHDPEVMASKAYSIVTDGNIFTLPKIDLAPVENGFQKLNISKEYFSDLAFMEYLNGAYKVDGEHRDDLNGNLTMMYGNMLGTEYRQGFLHHHCNNVDQNGNYTFDAFVLARNNVVQKIKDYEQTGDITPLADGFANLLNNLNPTNAGAPTSDTDQSAIQNVYIGRLMKILKGSKELSKAVIESGKVSREKLKELQGCARYGQYILDETDAKIKIAQAAKQGLTLSQQEMKDCYKAMLRKGLLRGEEYINVQKTLSKGVGAGDAGKLMKEVYMPLSLKEKTANEELRKMNPKSPDYLKKKMELEEIKKELEKVNSQMLQVADHEEALDRPMLKYLGSQGGKARYEKLIDHMIPENLTMDKLVKCSDYSYQFTLEYKLALNKATELAEAEKHEKMDRIEIKQNPGPDVNEHHEINKEDNIVLK